MDRLYRSARPLPKPWPTPARKLGPKVEIDRGAQACAGITEIQRADQQLGDQDVQKIVCWPVKVILAHYPSAHWLLNGGFGPDLICSSRTSFNLAIVIAGLVWFLAGRCLEAVLETPFAAPVSQRNLEKPEQRTFTRPMRFDRPLHSEVCECPDQSGAHQELVGARGLMPIRLESENSARLKRWPVSSSPEVG